MEKDHNGENLDTENKVIGTCVEAGKMSAIKTIMEW